MIPLVVAVSEKGDVESGAETGRGVVRFLVSRFFLDNINNFFIPDVPDPPGRPLVTGFTSRSVDLTWAKPRVDKKEAPIMGYIITTG